MPTENTEVARLFRETADRLEIQQANTFRVRAYRYAARTVEQLTESVADLSHDGLGRLTALPGVGRDLAGKIRQIVDTGTFPLLEELRRETSTAATELTRVPGVGPKRARTLHDTLGVETLDELRRAAEQHRIREIPGFGARTEEKILRELEAVTSFAHRVLRSTAVPYAEAVLEYIRGVDGVRRAEVAGSYRRAKETVGDIDLLVACRPGCPVVERFTGYPDAADVVAKGPKRATIRLRSGLQVDLRVLPEESYGAGLHYFTGSQPHVVTLRRIAQQRKLKINEYGVFRGEKRIAGRTEEEVFAAVGLPWIPPELREDRGEIAAAERRELPRLVERRHIRGDLQAHTDATDGRDTLEAMARVAAERGYEYIAITDHSEAVRVAHGLDPAGFGRQKRRIAALNRRLDGITILTGAEVDIRADGTLDLADDVLRSLDVVLVALHSRLDMPAARQTERVLTALRNPNVDVFSHPRGRLIDRRRGAEFDLERVVRAATDHGVMLEVNAQPDRLDLDDVACKAAIDHGAMLVISTDAHSTGELDNMRWGVDQARRGWARKSDVANTLPLERLRQRLHGARR